jgi:hypothetical protein
MTWFSSEKSYTSTDVFILNSSRTLSSCLSDRVGVVPCGGWPGGCVTVLGVSGWVWSRVWGGRVGVTVFGWTGGCVPVLGVVGWVSHCLGGVQVGVSLFWGWSGGCGPAFGMTKPD